MDHFDGDVGIVVELGESDIKAALKDVIANRLVGEFGVAWSKLWGSVRNVPTRMIRNSNIGSRDSDVIGRMIRISSRTSNLGVFAFSSLDPFKSGLTGRRILPPLS